MRSNAVQMIFAFSLGAAAGSLVAWRVLKTKYEKFAQREIDAYKEYANIRSGYVNDSEEVEETAVDTGKDDESNVIANLVDQYKSNNVGKEDDKKVSKPYIISPDDYELHQDYEKKSLVYYADGVIADEWDTVLKNADDLIGENIGDHFGEYEEDSVFVRHDDLECDFEICRDLQTYAEAMGIDYPDDTED